VNNGGNWITVQTDRDFMYHGIPYIVEVREPQTIWVNEYPNGLSRVHYFSKEDADKEANPRRITCHEFRGVSK
jgi:hypothetical protein